MRHLPRLLATFSLPMIAMMFAPQSAEACSCAPKPTVENAHREATAVFTGRVTSVEPSPLREGQLEVNFTVRKAYKGAPADMGLERVVVFTPMQEAECMFDFQQDQDYLVFATGNLAYYKVNRCGRTGQLEISLDEIAELEKLGGKAPATAQASP